MPSDQNVRPEVHSNTDILCVPKANKITVITNSAYSNTAFGYSNLKFSSCHRIQRALSIDVLAMKLVAVLKPDGIQSHLETNHHHENIHYKIDEEIRFLKSLQMQNNS